MNYEDIGNQLKKHKEIKDASVTPLNSFRRNLEIKGRGKKRYLRVSMDIPLDIALKEGSEDVRDIKGQFCLLDLDLKESAKSGG